MDPTFFLGSTLVRELTIATAERVNARKWYNRSVTLEYLMEKVKNTIRTVESIDEYKKMKSADKLAAKDHGGFVGGAVSEGIRDAKHIKYRSMLTLDADSAELGLIDNLAESEFFLIIYSTHGHTRETPRIRVLVPLTRDITPDEYNALSRFFADRYGINQFDPVSFLPHQLMFWPSTPKDGEYVFLSSKGNSWLNPDEVLSQHPDWKDMSTLPKTTKECTIRERKSKAEDPIKKGGIIGAFCSVYPIEDAIRIFLSDTYEETSIENRFSYIPADSVAGLQTFENRFAFSHHASDPAFNRLLNAFDLVRIHLFGNEDSDPSIPTSKQPSYASMLAFAANDENVKKYRLQEKMGSAKDDFSESDDWMLKLEIDKNGNLKDTLDNLILILENDVNLKGVVLNTLSGIIEIHSPVPWKTTERSWRDLDYAALKAYLSSTYGVYAPGKTMDAFGAVIKNRGFNPLADYLAALPPWDRIPRIDTLFIDYLGADDSAYVRAVTRKTLVAAIARVYNPGVKFDEVTILCGPQGIGKSTIFSRLGGPWFSDSLTLTDMKDKAGAEKLQGYWILELSELSGLKKADVETVKSFISRTSDKYRPSYGRVVEDHPRSCIIVGSTNAETGFLRDVTGNRRFWPINTTKEARKKPWNLTQEDVDQIWAEAYVRYQEGEELFLTGDESLASIKAQSDAMESDEREGLVADYLNMLIPENWDSMDLGERRNYISLYDVANPPEGSRPRKFVCNPEIWAECFNKDPACIQRKDSYEIAAIMKKQEGWSKYEGTINGSRSFPIYGKQRAYEKKIPSCNEQGGESC